MNLIIDFDRTLFNTDKLYKDLLMLPETTNEIKNLLMNYSEKVSRNDMVFNPFEELMQISFRENINTTSCIDSWKMHLKTNGDKYKYSDVETFFKWANNIFSQITILTYGSEEFQKIKISSCKISTISETNFVISKEKKWHGVLFFVSPNTIFIDDNPREIKESKKKYPQIRTIQISRRDTKYEHQSSAYADFLISDLSISSMKNILSKIDWHRSD